MKCPYCNKEAKWVENKEVYGKNYGKSFMMWLCKPCDAYVGCHLNSKRPLGTMANKELRQWRVKAHSVIDPIWKSGEEPRKSVYSKLEEMFGRKTHIAECDIEACKAIVNLF